jgi:hypothetical protein
MQAGALAWYPQRLLRCLPRDFFLVTGTTAGRRVVPGLFLVPTSWTPTSKVRAQDPGALFIVINRCPRSGLSEARTGWDLVAATGQAEKPTAAIPFR